MFIQSLPELIESLEPENLVWKCLRSRAVSWECYYYILLPKSSSNQN